MAKIRTPVIGSRWRNKYGEYIVTDYSKDRVGITWTKAGPDYGIYAGLKDGYAREYALGGKTFSWPYDHVALWNIKTIKDTIRC